jgi:uncharacterized protein involved in exopolysaccharide biosynthesis
MKFLVRRDRVDPVVTAEPNAVPRFGLDVNEEELRSEVELLKSRDLLERAVVASGVAQPETTTRWASLVRIAWPNPAESTEKGQRSSSNVQQAVRDLEERLRVERLGKTNLMVATYESVDPQQCVRLLAALAELYIEKHLAVHRATGAFDFFQQEADRSQKRLSLIEARLADFRREEQIVSAPLEKELALRNLTELERRRREAQATISETSARIRSMERQLALTSDRLTTQVRRRENHELLQGLKATLLNLELKQIGLLARYDASYPTVLEVNQQLAQTQRAIAAAEGTPLREETSDRNPVHDALNAELSRTRTELVALTARAAALAHSVSDYRRDVQRLDEKQVVQHDLERAVRLEEEGYLLYQRKREEARIADALDQKRILNVSLVEAPTVPFEASRPPAGSILLLGLLLAPLVSVGSALAVDRWEPTLRTSDKVRAVLNTPVLAVDPAGDKW